MCGLALAAPCIAILATAWWLLPNDAGYGTHTQLGFLPPCSFLVRTGWPCVGCGVTTSLSLSVRGRLPSAWAAQPFGVVLFAAILAAALCGTLQMTGGWPILDRFHPRWWWLAVGLAGLLAGWGYKALIGYLAGEYPIP